MSASFPTSSAARARLGRLESPIAPRSKKKLPSTRNLLEVGDLRTHFASERGEVHAVDGVDLSLERGRTLGIVGESGCGKSVTALSIMGLVPPPPARIAGGEVLVDGEALLQAPAR